MNERAALALLVVFFVVIVGVRALVQARRTGEHGLRPTKAAEPRIKIVADAFWLVVTLCFSGAVLIAHLHLLPPLFVVHVGVGASVAAVGIALAFVSQLAMGSSWRIGLDAAEKTALVTTGPYAIVRNPIYTCVLLFLAGLVLLVPNALMIVSWPLAVVGVQMQVRLVEEPHLLALHGDTYRDYTKRVGRLLPFIGRAG